MMLALSDLWGWDPPKLGLEVMIVPFREKADGNSVDLWGVYRIELVKYRTWK